MQAARVIGVDRRAIQRAISDGGLECPTPRTRVDSETRMLGPECDVWVEGPAVAKGDE